jgi:hypothetical protein
VGDFIAEHEGGNGLPAILLRLCGEDERVEFSERHMMDLQELLEDS